MKLNGVSSRTEQESKDKAGEDETCPNDVELEKREDDVIENGNLV